MRDGRVTPWHLMLLLRCGSVALISLRSNVTLAEKKYSSLKEHPSPCDPVAEANGAGAVEFPTGGVQPSGTTAQFKPGSLTPTDFCSLFSKNKGFLKQMLIGCWLIHPSLLKSKWCLSCHCDSSVILIIVFRQLAFILGPTKSPLSCLSCT